MAGRYVIVEFDDKGLAEAFVDDEVSIEAWGYKPVGMYLKPKVVCQCPDKPKQNASNWRKHSVFGLYICNRCKRPSRHHVGGILKRLEYVFGFNILDHHRSS